MSDNGFHMGEHRMIAGKDTAYEPDIRVPMIIRGPGVPEDATVDALALNIDLAPTFAALAGVATPAFVDGRSLLPLLAGGDRDWRQSFLIERRQLEEQYIALARSRGITDEQLKRHGYLDGLRTARWSYVEYGSGERELYDLASDPAQLDNMVERADPDLLEALSWRLAELAGCAGQSCRDLEDLPLRNDQLQPAAVRR
jgi:arylsulfatase A-like enzyme